MDITYPKEPYRAALPPPHRKATRSGRSPPRCCARAKASCRNMVQCNDTRAALQVAADLGAKISAHEDTYTLHGGLHPRKRQLNIGESGLATRLFTPITALCTETITLTGKGSILKRPISMMEEPLRQLGATVSSQRRLPADPHPGSHPRRQHYGRRFAQFAVHHRAADGAAAGRTGHDPDGQRPQKPAVHRHDDRAAEKFRHRHQTQRLPAVLHRRKPTLRPDALPHRRRLERRLVPAGRRSHGRSDHGRKPESAVATSRHGHHRRPDPGRGRNHDDGRFGHRPP